MEQATTGRKAITEKEVAAVMEALTAIPPPPNDPMTSLECAIAKREAMNTACRVMGWRNLGNELYTIGAGERSVTVTGRLLDRFVEDLRRRSGTPAPSDTTL